MRKRRGEKIEKQIETPVIAVYLLGFQKSDSFF